MAKEGKKRKAHLSASSFENKAIGDSYEEHESSAVKGLGETRSPENERKDAHEIIRDDDGRVNTKKKKKKKKRRASEEGVNNDGDRSGGGSGGVGGDANGREHHEHMPVSADESTNTASSAAAATAADAAGATTGGNISSASKEKEDSSLNVHSNTSSNTTTTPNSLLRTNQAEKQPQQQPGHSTTITSTPSSPQTAAPPDKRRRLGKTHGRARKTPPRAGATNSGGGGGFGKSEGGTASSSPTLDPGGPGQGRPRKHTLSIAIPGSVVDNAQNRELKTYLVGEIARAAAIFEVDEIVVYDDLSVSRKGQGGVRDASTAGRVGWDNAGDSAVGRSGGQGWATSGAEDRNNPNVFMARLLQFAETPQYLRKQLFPMHPTLKLAGLLNPLDAPHHMRADEDCPYREGVVVDRQLKAGAGSLVDVGKRKEARIDRPLAAGVRVTVKLDKNAANRKNYCGRAVPPSAPREELGLYWGYQTRLASGMADVLAGCPYKGGYDLTMGTSERGSITVDDPNFALPEYRHVLLVFGGVQGIEATVDADETLQLPGNEASALFDMWVNTCPGQGSRTIRTEEAVLITLARMRRHVLNNTGVKKVTTGAVTTVSA